MKKENNSRFMVWFMVVSLILLNIGCSDTNLTPKKGYQDYWYRVKQYDFDGTFTIYYNKEGKINSTRSSEFINVKCETEHITVSIGSSFTWISVDTGYHSGIAITKDGTVHTPHTVYSTYTQWRIPSSFFEEDQWIHIQGHAKYSWQGSALNCNSLPIRLKSFTVFNEGDYNHIEIVTAMEEEADYLQIQRSNDFKYWEDVVTIPLENSPTGATYTYLDKL